MKVKCQPKIFINCSLVSHSEIDKWTWKTHILCAHHTIHTDSFTRIHRTEWPFNGINNRCICIPYILDRHKVMKPILYSMDSRKTKVIFQCDKKRATNKSHLVWAHSHSESTYRNLKFRCSNSVLDSFHITHTHTHSYTYINYHSFGLFNIFLLNECELVRFFCATHTHSATPIHRWKRTTTTKKRTIKDAYIQNACSWMTKCAAKSIVYLYMCFIHSVSPPFSRTLICRRAYKTLSPIFRV